MKQIVQRSAALTKIKSQYSYSPLKNVKRCYIVNFLSVFDQLKSVEKGWHLMLLLSFLTFPIATSILLFFKK